MSGHLYWQKHAAHFWVIIEQPGSSWPFLFVSRWLLIWLLLTESNCNSFFVMSWSLLGECALWKVAILPVIYAGNLCQNFMNLMKKTYEDSWHNFGRSKCKGLDLLFQQWKRLSVHVPPAQHFCPKVHDGLTQTHILPRRVRKRICVYK